MAEGYGHSDAFVQDTNGNWIVGAFGGTAANHIKASIEGERGKFYITNTRRKSLEAAVKYIAKRRGIKSGKAFIIEITSDGDMDLKTLNEMYDEYDEINIKNSKKYKLVGYSCLDNSFEIIRKSGVLLPPHLISPNLTYKSPKMTGLSLEFRNLFFNIARVIQGKSWVHFYDSVIDF